MIPFDQIKRKIRKITPRKLKEKIYHDFLLNFIAERKYLNYDQRIKTDCELINNSIIDFKMLDLSQLSEITVEYISDKYLNHEYDLLGSGWVSNKYDSVANGMHEISYRMNVSINRFDENGNWLKEILNNVNLVPSKKIWTQISNNYEPIDWQKDFKSGYRWTQKKWFKDQQIGKFIGSDIKVPWELGRLQHLLQLSIIAIKLEKKRDRIIHEFRNEVLDFIATNPPGMGVQWSCTMDVAIRSVNLLLAFDILTQLDSNEIFDDQFKQIFSNSIYEHGIHISQNLEWSSHLRNNHYLADLTGLIFIGIYLPASSKSANWLHLGIQEFTQEIGLQFNSDGSNFEASTCYHKLSGEMLVHTVAAILGNQNEISKKLKSVSPEKWKLQVSMQTLNGLGINFDSETIFPEWVLNRIYNAGKFTSLIMKKNNEVSQIGDNDSGYFLKLSSVGVFLTIEEAREKYVNLKNYKSENEIYWDENSLDHSPFISAISGLYNDTFFVDYAMKYPLEKSFVRSLSKWKIFQSINEEKLEIQSKVFDYSNLQFKNTTKIKPELNSEKELTENINFDCFQDFGLFVFKSDRLDLIIFAGPIGQNNLGGHAHNDKLSFELNMDGKDYFKDSGSYCYTPFPEYRNKFRSIHSHHVMIPNDLKEQNSFQQGISGLFAMDNETTCSLISYSKTHIAIKLSFRDTIQVREFVINPFEIVVNDFSNKLFVSNFNGGKSYSNGYGKLING